MCVYWIEARLSLFRAASSIYNSIYSLAFCARLSLFFLNTCSGFEFGSKRLGPVCLFLKWFVFQEMKPRKKLNLCEEEPTNVYNYRLCIVLKYKCKCKWVIWWRWWAHHMRAVFIYCIIFGCSNVFIYFFFLHFQHITHNRALHHKNIQINNSRKVWKTEKSRKRRGRMLDLWPNSIVTWGFEILLNWHAQNGIKPHAQ